MTEGGEEYGRARADWGLGPELGPYRGGRVHVLAGKCGTCIFRPGNLMRLAPGRVKGMVESSVRDGGAIVCHSTLGTPAPAVCRGFWDAHGNRVVGLRLARAIGVVAEDPVPPSLYRAAGE